MWPHDSGLGMFQAAYVWPERNGSGSRARMILRKAKAAASFARRRSTLSSRRGRGLVSMDFTSSLCIRNTAIAEDTHEIFFAAIDPHVSFAAATGASDNWSSLLPIATATHPAGGPMAVFANHYSDSNRSRTFGRSERSR